MLSIQVSNVEKGGEFCKRKKEWVISIKSRKETRIGKRGKTDGV